MGKVTIGRGDGDEAALAEEDEQNHEDDAITKATTTSNMTTPYAQDTAISNLSRNMWLLPDRAVVPVSMSITGLYV